jgi:hypothetical protein
LVGDWTKAIDSALRNGNYEASDRGWTKDKAYLVMLHFLQELFDAKRDDIRALIREMELVDGKPRDQTLIEPIEP